MSDIRVQLAGSRSVAVKLPGQFAIDQAAASAAAAEDERIAAQAARSRAESARDTATTQAGLASTARSGAEAARDTAAGAASTATTQAGLATTARTAAQSARDTATAAATTATGQASAASTARAGAESARDTAVTARSAAEAARDTATGAASTATTQAGLATTARSAAEAARDTALAYRNTTIESTGTAVAAADNAAASAAIAEAAASAPGLTLIGGIGFTQRNISVGVSPSNVRYEMNSGGQPAFVDKIMHVASVGNDRALIEGFSFNDTGKPAIVQFGKNRGDGTPGSPTFGRKTLTNDRLFLLGVYGGKDSDGTTTAFAHAGYLTWQAEYDNNGSNYQDAMVHLRPETSDRTVLGPGNGLQINCRMQASFAGKNRAAYLPQTNHEALLRIGPGGAGDVPLRFTPATLLATPVEGGVEQDETGVFYITQGLTGSLVRRAVETNQPSPALTVSGITGQITATLLGSGMGWAKVQLTIGGSNYSAAGASICSLSFASSFSAIPIVVGSRETFGATATDGGHDFAFNGRSDSRITITLVSGTLQANQTYRFNLIWKIP